MLWLHPATCRSWKFCTNARPECFGSRYCLSVHVLTCFNMPILLWTRCDMFFELWADFTRCVAHRVQHLRDLKSIHTVERSASIFSKAEIGFQLSWFGWGCCWFCWWFSKHSGSDEAKKYRAQGVAMLVSNLSKRGELWSWEMLLEDSRT